MRSYISLLFWLLASTALAGSGKWQSSVTGSTISYTTSSATGTAAKDGDGKAMTVVYMENLGFEKIGQNSNAVDVAWLRSQGYQVIYPDSYKSSQGDSLFLDLVYPANPSHQVPVVVTFSYSNSCAANGG